MPALPPVPPWTVLNFSDSDSDIDDVVAGASSISVQEVALNQLASLPDLWSVANTTAGIDWGTDDDGVDPGMLSDSSGEDLEISDLSSPGAKKPKRTPEKARKMSDSFGVVA